MITPEAILARFPDAPQWRISHPDASPYLDRYVLWGLDCLDNHDASVKSHCFLHRIHTRDSDRDRHSHPWKHSTSLILSGGYVEGRSHIDDDDERTHIYRAGDINNLYPNEYHTIVSVLPDTWTLFISGPEVTDWGFRVNGKHVGHAEYFKIHGAAAMTHSRIK